MGGSTDGTTTGPVAPPETGAGGNGNGSTGGGTTAPPPGDGGQGTAAPPEGTWVPGPGGTTIISAPTGYIECNPSAPIRIAANACVNQETVNAVDGGWNVQFLDDGTPVWKPPATHNPTTGQWGSFNGAAQACNPTIEVKLKQAALAGSQITRAISDKQLAYSQTDPIEAVNNPKKDGAGGVCTIDIFAFDLGRLLGSTYAQIKNMIDMLSNLSVDSLFGAACNVINNIFGNLQNQLLNELQTNSPLSQFQQPVDRGLHLAAHLLHRLRLGYPAHDRDLAGCPHRQPAASELRSRKRLRLRSRHGFRKSDGGKHFPNAPVASGCRGASGRAATRNPLTGP